MPQFSGVADAFPSMWNEEESMAAVFSCPFGWKVHEVPAKGIPAALTKRDVSWEEGWKLRECIYMSFASKREFPNIKDLFAFHESESLKNYLGVEFEYFEEADKWFQNSFCEKLIFRIGYYRQYPETEATIFLDFGTFYSFFVLITPVKNRDQNTKKLAFVARTTIPYDLPRKSSVLPIEYMKFHFIPNLFTEQNKK